MVGPQVHNTGLTGLCTEHPHRLVPHPTPPHTLSHTRPPPHRYYVRSLLNLDERDLRSAWSRAASATKQGGDKDARLQYLSWRIWFMKRRHALVQQARRAAEAHEEESVGTTEVRGCWLFQRGGACGQAGAARGLAAKRRELLVFSDKGWRQASNQSRSAARLGVP